MTIGESGRPLTAAEQRFAVAVEFFNRWKPYRSQLPIGQAIDRGVRVIFARIGRSGGKSYGGVGLAVRRALYHPKSRIYYFAPLLKQVRDIVWFPGLIDEFLHPCFVENRDKQDLRYSLINGSYIKCDGSDNFAAIRGYKPDLVIADEYADFHPDWLDVMLPNLLARKATLVILGTPPEFPILPDGTKHHYVAMDEECRKEMKRDPGYTFWVHLPSSVNPHNTPEDLARMRRRAEERGELYVYHREYDALIVSGAKNQIFPMLGPQHKTEHDRLMAEIAQDPERYEFWCGADPAYRSVFAVLFMALDRYEARPYWLDEIYEQDPSQTSSHCMNPRILAKMADLGIEPEQWNMVADCAAAGYIEESANHPEHPLLWTPCRKELKDKNEGISLLKDVFLARTGCISDRCEFTFNELTNYTTDKWGKVVKDKDHTIDLSRYILKEAGFDFVMRDYPKKKAEDPEEHAYLRPARRIFHPITDGQRWEASVMGAY